MKFALFISHVFDPLWVIPAVTLLKASTQGFLFSFALMILIFGIPLILRFRYRKHDWDVAKREDRPQVIAALLSLGCITIIFSKVFGNTEIMQLLFFYEIWLFGFFLISLFWKISGHAGGVTLATGLIILWFGLNWWPILILVPLMGWARVVTKNHTVAQVITGTAYSFILLIAYETWRIIL